MVEELARRRMTDTPLVVLDDDPTGVQTSSNVPVVLRWDADRVARALRTSGSVHIVTDSRSLSAAAAFDVVRDAAQVAIEAAPDASIMLRGDSTLRGHLLEEYLAVSEVAFPGVSPVHVIALAHPLAGRLTLDGVQVLRSGDDMIPLDQTEYARDPHLGYRSSHVLRWADERSSGYFSEANGVSVGLAALHRDGPRAVVDAIGQIGGSREPGVCAVDAASVSDLEIVSAGIRDATRTGCPVVVRGGPTMAGVLGGVAASTLIDVPTSRTCLILCGSWTELSTRQLDALHRWSGRPALLVDIDAALGSEQDRSEALSTLADRASMEIASSGWAAIATPRQRTSLDERDGRRLARWLARIVAHVEPAPGSVIAKGGITSTAVVRDGFGTPLALAEGPVAPGVSCWKLEGDRDINVLVVPGNVGEADLLVDLVSRTLQKEETVARSLP